MGAHRFDDGKPLSGTLWFLTRGLLGIGWLIDLFLVPGMHRRAQIRYAGCEVSAKTSKSTLRSTSSSAASKASG